MHPLKLFSTNAEVSIFNTQDGWPVDIRENNYI